MTPVTRLQSMRPTAMLQASHCPLSAWPFFTISISTMSSGQAWRFVWPCATWSIGRSVITRHLWVNVILLSFNCGVLDLIWHLCSTKALCLNSKAFAKTTTGQIVNLLSNDVNKFDEVIIRNYLWLFVWCFACDLLIYLNFLFPGNLVFALLVDWSSTSSNCNSVVDVCHWTIMPCRNGCLLYPDANTDFIWTLVLYSEVFGLPMHQIYQILMTDIFTYEMFLSCVAFLYVCVCCFRAETAVLTDDRIRTMNEVISGIRVIKMYGWEKPFAALVDEVRR